MFGHHQRVHGRSTDKSARTGQLKSMMEQGSDSDEDQSDPEPSARFSEPSPSEVRTPARGPTSTSRVLRDELEAMKQEYGTRTGTLEREYKAKTETLRRAIDMLEKDD